MIVVHLRLTVISAKLLKESGNIFNAEVFYFVFFTMAFSIQVAQWLKVTFHYD